MNIKKKLGALGAMLGLLAGSILYTLPVAVTTGCGALSSVISSTNVDQTIINTTAILLRGAAQSGAATAIKDNPADAKYFQLATQALGTFITGTNYTPGAFQASLLAVGGGSLDNKWVQIGIGTVIDLYQLYYSQFVVSAVNGNAIATAFLTAIQDGFNSALGNPVAAKSYSVPLQLKLGASPSRLLPRPVR